MNFPPVREQNEARTRRRDRGRCRSSLSDGHQIVATLSSTSWYVPDSRRPQPRVVGARHEIQEIDLQVDTSSPLGSQWDALIRGPIVDVADENSKVREDSQSKIEVRQVPLAFIVEPDVQRATAVDNPLVAFAFTEEFHLQEANIPRASTLAHGSEI